jgi:diaminohydroxyphosphoribosylaminopyrimidine deaminase/5-amino-6-(5-phosphoribosylamino)uracil reductase
VRVEAVRTAGAGLDLAAALARLAELECNEVLVEAGPTLAGSLLAAGLVDEFVLYLAPTALGDAARPMLRLPVLERMIGRPEFEWFGVRKVGRDLRVTLRPKPPEEG